MVNRRKLVAIGDLSGKTFVIRTFLKDELPEPDPNILDVGVTDVEVNGTVVEVEIWDTNDKERYKPLRLTALRKSDVILIFFSIYSRHTFANIKNKWVPEVREHGPKGVPIVLVGTQSPDLQMFRKTCTTDETDDVITAGEIETMVREVGAVGCVECCADNKHNLEKVFEIATAATLRG